MLPQGVGAWEAIPYLGQAQILSVIFCLEWYAESQKPHYMKVSGRSSSPSLSLSLDPRSLGRSSIDRAAAVVVVGARARDSRRRSWVRARANREAR